MIGNDLTQGNVTKTLLRFTVPFLLGNLLHTLYGIVDMLIVGRFADSMQMAAVSIGALWMLTLNSFIMGFGTGATVITGQMCGAKREKDLEETISTVFSVIPLTAIVLMVICFLLRVPLLRLLQTPPESFAAAEAYFRICLYGTVFTGMYTAIAGVLRGMGDSKGPTIFVAIATGLNILGDYLCVGVWNMGAAGAALATTSAQGVSVLLGYIYLRRHNFPFDFKPRSFRIYPDKLRQLLTIGLPTALQEAIANISFLVLEGIINGFGYVATAAAGVVDRLFSVSTVPSFAFGGAISAMVAQNIGAGEYSRGRRCLRIGLLFSGCIAAVLVLLVLLFPAQAVGLFSKEPDVIRMGVDYLVFYRYDMLLYAIAFCILGYINGTGHTRYTMFVNLFTSFAIRVPLVWAVSNIAGATLYHIGIAMPIASIIQILMALAFVYFAKSEREHRLKPETNK